MALPRAVAGNLANASDLNAAIDMLNGNRSDGLQFGSDIVGWGVNLSLNTLPVPAAPVITQGGAAGSTNYTYEVVAINANGDGVPSATTQTTTVAATLTGSNYNIITWTMVKGASGYRIIRTASAGVPASTGNITTIANGYGANQVTANQPTIGTMSINDTGLTATAYVASTTNPGGKGFGMSQLSALTSTGTSVTFSAIDQTFRHLLLMYTMRTDRAAQTFDDMAMQLNADAGANYQYMQPTSVNAVGTVTNSTAIVATNASTAAVATASYFSTGNIWIPNYTNTGFFKEIFWQGTS